MDKKRTLKKGDKTMMNFKDFMETNKEKIYQMAEANTPKNKHGIPIITKDDSWRNETEWDDYGEEC